MSIAVKGNYQRFTICFNKIPLYYIKFLFFTLGMRCRYYWIEASISILSCYFSILIVLTTKTGQKKILIVDDDLDLTSMFKMVLEWIWSRCLQWSFVSITWLQGQFIWHGIITAFEDYNKNSSNLSLNSMRKNALLENQKQ